LTEGDEGMAKLNNLYDEDFVRWTEEQAAALRQAKGSNPPLDWEKLAEESRAWGGRTGANCARRLPGSCGTS
jgi:hypothetical protein